MKLKVDKGLLPIKAHFFFFFAALGPILPQINVFGRQLGVSPAAMGLVTAVLPLMWATAKPLFGYAVDYWPAHRKLVFMMLIVIMSGSYCCLWFLPMPEPETTEPPVLEYVYKLNDTVHLKRIDNTTQSEKYNCRWNCSTEYFDVHFSNSSFINTMYVDSSIDNSSCSLISMDIDDMRDGELTCTPKDGCNLLCYEEGLNTTDVLKIGANLTASTANRTKREVNNHIAVDLNKVGMSEKDVRAKVAKPLVPVIEAKTESNYNFYTTTTFWAFVVLSCVGTVAFNVANCIGDAVCFDVLGPERGSKYGAQRAWGTAGYGITALLGGWLVDSVSKGNYKDFTPAFVIAMAATAVDLYSCRALTAHRKLVFMMLIVIMSGSYCCLWFLPMPEPETTEPPVLEYVYKLNDTVYLKRIDNTTQSEKYNCRWNCSTEYFDVHFSNSSFINTMYVDSSIDNSSCSLISMDIDDMRDGELTCTPKDGCNLLCYEEGLNTTNVLKIGANLTASTANRTKREVNNHIAVDLNKVGMSEKDVRAKVAKPLVPVIEAKTESDYNFYTTTTFWAFVVLSCVGTVAFNVANCIGDAVCFDVLGPERGSKYGAQRAWGTAGYGITALLGGWLVDSVSKGNYKDFTPAFVIAMAATAVDLYSCRALTLPSLSSPSDSGAALRALLRMPRVLMFIVFAVIAGTFDSFIIYYMFWFLEELAEETGSVGKIKLIEGVVTAAECLVGELLFFFFSGKIIKRFGYGNTLTVSLFCYAIKMALISVIQHPWHLVFVAGVMQGPTYALCYSTIVGYAAQVAPEGYSATVQGIVAGMDDGVGESTRL
ncbi:hypothetical protein O3G_MSEX014757 [Manduca sexta]|uniref:Major facilitator superfamily (MFS) profile domain-containing protein n=1 Tax=Manduca sexta TaxID=7130 RepID=A0A921ZXY2_MANSE|nr:hypothetical protein O3G_MSEX014757 [Manduca sexta]